MRELHEHPGTAPLSVRPIQVFISYAHANRDVVELLLDHLGGLAERRADRDLRRPSARRRRGLGRAAEGGVGQADLVLFVVTAKFLRSSYCAKVELKETIRRREVDGIIVMPIIAEHCLWSTLPLARLQALPKDKNLQLKPLNKWGRDTDVALTQIAAQVEINVGRLWRGPRRHGHAIVGHAVPPARAAGGSPTRPIAVSAARTTSQRYWRRSPPTSPGQSSCTAAPAWARARSPARLRRIRKCWRATATGAPG